MDSPQHHIHHVVLQEQYHKYPPTAAPVVAAASSASAAAATAAAVLPASRVHHHYYDSYEQPKQGYTYQRHQQHDGYPETQHSQQELEGIRSEHRPATASAGAQPAQEQSQQQQQQQPRQRHQEAPKQQEVKQQQQRRQQPSINNLWSLIPGTLEREGSRSTGHHNNATNGNMSNGAPGQQCIVRDRRYAPDVHRPLSDIARRHRARALARLRARRQALAETALSSGRPAPVKSQSSETTDEADSHSDGKNDRHDDHQRHRSKVVVVDGGGGVARAVSGGVSRGVSGSVPRALSGGPASTTGGTSAAGAGDSEDKAAAAAAATVDGSSASGEEGASPATAGSRNGSAAPETTITATKTTPAAPAGGNSRADDDAADNSSKAAPGNSNASKVGDLFELMRNVTMNFGTGGDAVNGEESLARELGKPVKYRYRQEAARSRKRTRGRFVSEKAPAFVSVTELMALRRAEREQQKNEEVSPVPVGAG